MLLSGTTHADEGVLLVGDAAGLGAASAAEGQLVTVIDAGVVVRCRDGAAGRTTVTVLRTAPAAAFTKAFAGSLDTPSRRLAVRTVSGTTVLGFAVARDATPIEIWVNDDREPDRLVIVLA